MINDIPKNIVDAINVGEFETYLNEYGKKR